MKYSDPEQVLNYVSKVRQQLRMSLLFPEKFSTFEQTSENQLIRNLQQSIIESALDKGISLETAVRLTLEELERPMDNDAMLAFIERKQALMLEDPESKVPEGREADFPNLVFYEQMLGAVANSVGIDMGAVKASGKEPLKAEQFKQVEALGGIEHRI